MKTPSDLEPEKMGKIEENNMRKKKIEKMIKFFEYVCNIKKKE